MNARTLLVVAIAALAMASPSFAKVAAPPPAIGDITGIYEVKLSGTVAWVWCGECCKGKDVDTILLLPLDPNTVRVYSCRTDTYFRAVYNNGNLAVARGEVADMSYWTDMALLKVSGTPGKLKLEGTMAGYDIYAGFAEFLSVSGKQAE